MTKTTEGLFLELTDSDRRVIERVLGTLGSDYSPNGIVRAFYTLDKWLSVKNVVTGKGNILDVLKNFAR